MRKKFFNCQFMMKHTGFNVQRNLMKLKLKKIIIFTSILYIIKYDDTK